MNPPFLSSYYSKGCNTTEQYRDNIIKPIIFNIPSSTKEHFTTRNLTCLPLENDDWKDIPFLLGPNNFAAVNMGRLVNLTVKKTSGVFDQIKVCEGYPP